MSDSYVLLALVCGISFAFLYEQVRNRDQSDVWFPGGKLLSQDELHRILAIWQACQEE
jgi:hypothetical protein